MNQNAFDLLHDTYCRATQEANVLSSNSPVSNLDDGKNSSVIALKTLELFLQGIDDSKFSFEDRPIIKVFRDGIKGEIRKRQQIADINLLCKNLMVTGNYFSLWINKDVSLTFCFRVKEVNSALAKLLSRAIRYNGSESAVIRDTFGIKGIVSPNSFVQNEQDLILHLYKMDELFSNIIASIDADVCQAFKEWVSLSKDIPSCDKEAIFMVLSIPFSKKWFKDYIKNPKPNGYQSIHSILEVQQYSKIEPGVRVEVQLRTKLMEEMCEKDWDHRVFKNLQLGEEIVRTFNLNA